MNTDAIKAMYERALDTYGPGYQLTLRRGFSPDNTDYLVHGWVTGFDPEDLVGSITQGKRKAIILASDVVSAAFPLPFKPNQDSLLWLDTWLVIHSVDAASRAPQGVIIAYELELAGA